MDSMNTKEKGERSVGALIGQLIKRGIPVLMPLGDCLRYDLVIQKEGVFKSVQCKTAHLAKDGAVLRFKACSQNVLTAERRSYRGEVDFFGVYSPELDKSYLVPISEISGMEAYLRVKPMLRKTTKNQRWGPDFEL